MAEQHSFSVLFPLPYRVSFEIIAGVWGWGLNVHALSLAHIDVGALVRYQTGRALHKSVYQFATLITGFYIVSLVIFWLTVLRTGVPSHEGSKSLHALDFLPWFTFVILIAAFLYPGGLHSNGRRRFFRIFRRIGLGRLDRDNRLQDIILADTLTSYSKVLLDIAIMSCMFISGQTCLDFPNRKCGGGLLVPFVSSIPFVIRMRQCLLDLTRTGDRMHVLNFLKYVSSYVVILLSALQGYYKGIADVEDNTGLLNDKTISSLWILSVLINSSYSFIWDVTCDWDLSLIPSLFSATLRNGGLRRTVYFSRKSVYYVAIILDLALRFTWSLKMSPHWYNINDHESGIFTLELLEIFRRWLWIFFRVEAEWVRSLKDPIQNIDVEMVSRESPAHKD